MNVAFGTTGVTATVTGVSNTSNVCPPTPGSACFPMPDEGFNDPGNLLNGPNIDTYTEPDQPAGLPAITTGICCVPGMQNVFTWSFNKPVIAPIVHVVNLDGSYADLTGSTTTGAPITLTPLAKNASMEITGNRLNSTTQGPAGGGCVVDGGAPPPSNGACGSLQLNGPGELVQSFMVSGVQGPLGADGWTFAVSFPTAPLTKQFSPNRIPVGGTSQLTFTIANPADPSQPTLTPLDFTDALPANVTLADGAVTNNGSCGTPSVTGPGGAALGAGDTNVSATNISVAAGATCTITVNVTSSTPGNYVNDNTNLATTVANLIPNASTPLEVYPVADVEIVKSAEPSPAVPGEDVTFRLAVTNKGPNAAANVVVTDDLPDAVTFKSASQGCAQAAGVVTCTLASLAAGGTHTFEIVAAVASSVTQCIQNTATVTNTTADTNLANNGSTICVPVVGRSGVSMTKAASTATVAAGGGQVMYTLVVRNNGPSDDPGVKVTDPLPAGLTLVSAEASQGSCTTAGNTVACDLGPLKNGGSAQVLVTVNTTATPGCIINTARAQGTREDPNAADNQASAQVCVPAGPPAPPPVFDLAVDKTASVSRPVIGQSVTYRIVVTNNGPGAAPNAKVTDTYNNRATVVSVRTTQGNCTEQLPITCSLGRIEARGSVTITMVIKPLESGRQRNAASATSCCGTDSTPDNNMDTADVTVQKVPLRVTKVASSSSVRAGSTLSYRIRVSNPSKGVARNVKVCDRLPSGLSFVSSTPRATRSGSQRCWTISSLAAGKSRTFRVTVRAANGANGRKTNTATASSPDSRTARAKDPVRVLGVATPVTG